MDNIKPWQIILIAVAVVVLGFSVFRSIGGLSPEAQLGKSMMLVDANTGQLYKADISGRNGLLIPARSPESDEYALVPVIENEEGEWVISERYKGTLSQLTVDPTAIPNVDQPVRTNGKNPLTYSR